MGYPVYLVKFLGVAKLSAIVAILFLKSPRLKEWAYAGLFFDLIGALYSHIAYGDPVSKWIGVFIPIALLMSSYLLYHKRNEKSSQN